MMLKFISLQPVISTLSDYTGKPQHRIRKRVPRALGKHTRRNRRHSLVRYTRRNVIAAGELKHARSLSDGSRA